MARFFEEFQEGEQFISTGRTITETDVVNFAALSGDWNELHVNEQTSSKGYFGRRIAHGALIFSISTGLASQIERARYPVLIAFYGVDRMRFIRPTFFGDTILLRQTVQSLEPKDEKSGFINLLREVLNQDETVVLSYVAKVLVRRQPVAAISAAVPEASR